MRTRIKICGITRPEDAMAAARAGVDAIGLVFYDPSPRVVTIEQAHSIVAELPPFLSVVGLFVNPEVSEVQKTLDAVALDLLQFHGDESADFCRGFGRPWIKAVRMHAAGDYQAAEKHYPDARGLLADTYSAERYGGTGAAFDWAWLPKERRLPLILAGGLEADRVTDAVRQARPWAVDVSGGVESAPGIKDRVRIEQFVRSVWSAEQD